MGEAAGPPPTPLPTGTATALPTVSVEFIVRVTPATHVVAPVRRRPTPQPTRFVIPAGPFLVIDPQVGPPISQAISVHGGHLPQNVQVELIWAPGGRVSPITTTAGTDKRGNLATRFRVPASPPGNYTIIADANGLEYASARYRVSSYAELSVDVLSGGLRGVSLTLRGSHFIPRQKLVVVAFPLFRGPQPVVVAHVYTGRHGKFRIGSTVARLQPGQYAMRALASSAASMQMAETFFQVVS